MDKKAKWSSFLIFNLRNLLTCLPAYCIDYDSQSLKLILILLWTRNIIGIKEMNVYLLFTCSKVLTRKSNKLRFVPRNHKGSPCFHDPLDRTPICRLSTSLERKKMEILVYLLFRVKDLWLSSSFCVRTPRNEWGSCCQGEE